MECIQPTSPSPSKVATQPFKLRGQRDLQSLAQLRNLLGGNGSREIGEHLFLPWLPKHHAIEHQRIAQHFESLHVTTQTIHWNVSLDRVPTGKLQRRYWELPHVAGNPLVLAIQDFHAPHAMAWSNAALVEYLYAIRQTERQTADGRVEIVSERVTEYRWADKPPIPAGFFLQPDTENISAVLANPGGTISKFNRIGFLAGFGGRDIMMMRSGYCYKGSLTPEWFVTEVHKPGYEETWCEGLSVYHNPNARIPLSPAAVPCAAHHTSREGRILSGQPAFDPIGSTTHIIVPT